MSATAQPIEDQPDPAPSGTEIQLGDLGKLRALGMDFATELHRVAMAKGPEAEDSPLARDRNLALSFTRVSRAIRQIIVLEQELMGLRAVPVRHAANGNARTGSRRGDADREGGEGSDLNDLNDYNDLDDYNDRDDHRAEQEALEERIAAVLDDITGPDGKLRPDLQARADAEDRTNHPAEVARRQEMSNRILLHPVRRRSRGPP